MEVIVIDTDAYIQLIAELRQMILDAIQEIHNDEDVWLGRQAAMDMLGIKSTTKLQELRDEDEIVYSQFGRTIRYSRKGILEFLAKHKNR